MDALQRLLTAPVSGIADITEEDAPVGVWHGHSVQPFPLGRELGLQEGDEVAVEEVTGALEKHYGSFVKQEIEQHLVGMTALSDRDVAIIDKQARKIFREVRDGNQELIKSAVTVKWVGRLFEFLQTEPNDDRLRVSWNYLPEHEQQHMVESVRISMQAKQGVLTFDDIDREGVSSLKAHQTLFARSAPQITRFLENQGLEPPIKPGDLRDFAEELYFCTKPSGQEINRQELGLMRNADVLTNRTAKLLYNSPLEMMHEKTLGMQKQEAREHAKSLMRGLSAVGKYGENLPEAFQEAMIIDLRSQFFATVDHIHQLEVLEANNPLDQAHWQQCKQDELAVALDVLLAEEDRLGEEIEQGSDDGRGSKARFYNRINQLTDEFDDLAGKVGSYTDGDLLPSGEHSDELGAERLGRRPVQDASRYARLIARRLKGIGIKKVDKKLSEARTRRMASVPWKTVETRLEPRINNKTLKLKSRITPAAEFRLEMGHSRNVDIFPIHLHGKGKPSSKRDEMNNAVNLGETQLLLEQGGKQKRLFRGLRSGTLMAFGVSKKKIREKANDTRCYDLAVSSLKQVLDDNPELFSQQPVPIRLSTLQLLTPDKGRHWLRIHDDELKMQREQMEALKRLKARLDGGEKLAITDSYGDVHEVEVDFDFAATNFGVNNLALETKWRAMGPWGAVRDDNQEGLKKLMGGVEPGDEMGGWAQDFLNGQASSKDKMIVRQLIEQIRDLYVTEDYKREGIDAYKMVARILLLSYKLGLITHFNCKSGKDRTGEADAAVKRLAAQVEALGYVPDPRQPLSQAERVLSQMFALETGNILWQQMNINRPGYKTTTGKDRLGERVFGMIHV
ncbi:inositol phosphate phosphatase SopB [Endozoicomonas lisbonensis]|uniref:Uncharacterized protein n=1 Tax=Endozoicomonas lisbonensis TaxID=3120522 RepID=A0ABV2SLT3_9GAMM